MGAGVAVTDDTERRMEHAGRILSDLLVGASEEVRAEFARRRAAWDGTASEAARAVVDEADRKARGTHA